jgi:hypothetical protein
MEGGGALERERKRGGIRRNENRKKNKRMNYYF